MQSQCVTLVTEPFCEPSGGVHHASVTRAPYAVQRLCGIRADYSAFLSRHGYPAESDQPEADGIAAENRNHNRLSTDYARQARCAAGSAPLARERCLRRDVSGTAQEGLLFLGKRLCFQTITQN